MKKFKEHPSIVAFVDWCAKLGVNPCDERSVASYTNFVKAAKAVKSEVGNG